MILRSNPRLQRPGPWTGPWQRWGLVLVAATTLGCASRSEWVTVRTTPRNPLAETLQLVGKDGPKPSERTEQILRRYDVVDLYRAEPRAAIKRLAQIQREEPNGELQYSIAELAYVAGRRAERLRKEECLAYYGTSLLHAYRYLFDERLQANTNPYDPQFRGACDLYNQSLEAVLRIVQEEGDLRPGPSRPIEIMSQVCSLQVELHSSGWHEEDFDNVRFVNDYQIVGLRNHYHTYGLGVPLIAQRRSHDQETASEAYYPDKLTFPLTAFLKIEEPQRAGGPPRAGSSEGGPRFVLQLLDPLDHKTVAIGQKQVPLESDLSTPLAYFLNQPEFDVESLSTRGLLNPEGVQQLQGLYMIDPYDPKKMPVVMVHGLWSSPVTWMEMYNDLRSDPYLREHYQFWFYLYPTGQPFWLSAAQMRADLERVREVVDPGRLRPALDQTVLVGHSMGGLVSRLQSVDSGNDFWATMSDKAFTELDADPELKARLEKAFFFQPSPSVRRVITLGTPHSGSRFANDVTTWLGRSVIKMPMKLVQGRQELQSRNRDFFRPDAPLSITTSIESLAPETTVLSTLRQADPAPWVSYHNVVGVKPRDGWIESYFGSEGDGVVSLASASLEGVPRVKSQLVVTADHMGVHRHPQSVLEVRRILLEQIEELRQFPRQGSEIVLTQRPTRHQPTDTLREVPPPADRAKYQEPNLRQPY